MIVEETHTAVDKQAFDFAKNSRTKPMANDTASSREDLFDLDDDGNFTNLQNSREYSQIYGSRAALDTLDDAFMDEKKQNNVNKAWETHCNVSINDSSSAARPLVKSMKEASPADAIENYRLFDTNSPGNISSSLLENSISTSCSSLSSTCEERCQSPVVKSTVKQTNDKKVTKSRRRSSKSRAKTKPVLTKQASFQNTTDNGLENGDCIEIFPFGEGNTENNVQLSPETELPFNDLESESMDRSGPLQKRNSAGFPFKEVLPTIIQNFPFEDESDKSVEKLIKPSSKKNPKLCFDQLFDCFPDPSSEATGVENESLDFTKHLHEVEFQETSLPVKAKSIQSCVDFAEEDIIHLETVPTRGLLDQDDITEMLERQLEVEKRLEYSKNARESKNLVVAKYIGTEDSDSESEGSLQRTSSEESLGSVSSLEELPLNERIQNINRAFEWVRAELLAMRTQDITLKIQFDSLRQEVRTLWQEQEDDYHVFMGDIIEETDEEAQVVIEQQTQESPLDAPPDSKVVDLCKALREDSGYHSDTPSQCASDSTGGLDDKPQTHTFVTAYYQPVPEHAKVELIPSRRARQSGTCVFEIVL